MHVISKKPFNDAAKNHPDDRQALMDMYRVLRSTAFRTPEELKAVFPSLDNFKYKDKWYVLDVGGNNLRVMAFIQFANGRLYIKHIAGHAEYNRLNEKYRKEGKSGKRR